MTDPIEFSSPKSPSVIFACGSCGTIYAHDRMAAERCCVCQMCGGAKEKDRHGWTFCLSCQAKANEARNQKRREVPVVDPGDRPVYVADVDGYFADAAEAAECVWDDGHDPATVLAHPCNVYPAHTPDLVEYVEESWSSNYDDPDLSDGIPRGLAERLVLLQKELEGAAPTVWEPIYSERVALSFDERVATANG